MLVRVFSLCLCLTAAACADNTLPDWATGDYEPFDAGRSAYGGEASMDAGASALDAQADAEGGAPDGASAAPDGASSAHPSDATIGG